ncbi:MAG: tetratricopeptide repeat protein [Bacteroidota bacterium]
MKINAPTKKTTPRKPTHQAIAAKAASPSFFSRNERRWALILFLLAFALYANTIPNKYVLDDSSVMGNNFVVKRGIEGIPMILQTPYRYGFRLLSDNLYRPFSLIMFAIEWQIAPETPALGHFINILFYALTCSLLFFILRKIVPDKGSLLPLLVSLLWLFHPIHTEVVANIKSRDEIMSTFFLFLAILAFIRYLEKNRIQYLAGAMAAYLLAFFSKEGVVTFLVIFPLIGWYFTKSDTKRLVTASALLLVPAAIYLLIRHQVLSTYATPFSPFMGDNLLVAAPDIQTRLATAIMILGKYLLLLVFPYQLVSDYSYNQIPLVGWADPLVWASFLVYAGALIYAFMNVRKRSMVVFGLLYFLVTMSIYSNIFTLIGTSFAERLLFLPSVGFCLLAGIALLKLPGSSKPVEQKEGMMGIFVKHPAVWLATGIILVLFSMKTVARNQEWHDGWSLTMADVKRSPNSAHMRYYSGMAYREKAKEPENREHYNEIMQQAIHEFTACVTILPTFTEGYEQLGLANYRIKNTEEALRCYEKALQLNSKMAITYSNLGIIYFERGDFPKAMELYKKAVALDTNFEDGYYNLGSMYGNQGRLDLAVENFKKTLRINPGHAGANYFLGITYRSLNKPELAKEYLDRAGQLDPAYKK